MYAVSAVLSTEILDRNLAALARGSPGLVARLRGVAARSDAVFFATDDGVLGAEVGFGVGVQGLASRRRPLAEATRLVEGVDVAGAAVLAVAGFGLGYHVAALAQRVGRTGVVIVFEPDLGLLRAVLERVDHSSWLPTANVAILDRADDPAAISVLLQGGEGLVAIGVGLVEHPASRQRLGPGVKAFFESVVSVVSGLKMSIVTTLVQSRVTLQNLTQNLGAYARAPGVADLAGCCAGRPAVVVSAGPSLERNVGLLSRPGVRERVVIVAAQTVLKTLLSRGIRPHFVTALDFSELSRRFYEGLSARDVEGVTLVLDAKVNPAVVDAFPGTLRIMGDKYLDLLLGSGLARPASNPRGALKAGATVAHLCYYLARHLGCDPVGLIGQDLGFTDGQYYAAGAAIHDVWAPELNEFNTLETMEWQRIVRMGSHLRRATDVLGRPVFTDEQMGTYLVQFERDFSLDAELGLTTVDATEGGVRKQHTRVTTLEAFLSEYAGPERPPITLPPVPAPTPVSARRLEDRLRSVRAQAWRVGEVARKTGGVLAEMMEHQSDQERVNRCIARVDALREEATGLDPAYSLTQVLNQTGGLHRIKADREIALDSEMSAMERQRRQLERDAANVGQIAEAADQIGMLLEAAVATLGGGPKRTRDLLEERGVVVGGGLGAFPVSAGEPGRDGGARGGGVFAVIPVDLERSGLGTGRRVDAPIGGLGLTALGMTLARLSRVRSIKGVVLATNDEAGCRAAAGVFPPGLRVSVARVDRPIMHGRRAGVASARLWSPESWRGGVGGMTCFDEVFDPALLRGALDHVGGEAVLLVGPDWCLVDPGLCDGVIGRLLEDPEKRRVTFTQAPPGLCGVVMSGSLIADIAESEHAAGHLATMGAMLGFVPSAPIGDMIGAPSCVPIDPRVRSAAWRFIADSPERVGLLAEVVSRLGAGWADAPAPAIVAALNAVVSGGWASVAPAHVRVEVTGGGSPTSFVSPELVERLGSELARARPDGVVTLCAGGGGGSDPAAHAELVPLVRSLRACGVAGVHLRTRGLTGELLGAVLDAGASVVSLETLRPDEALMSVSTERRAGAGGAVPPVWLVGRLTRRDATYAHIEDFYDSWMRATGAAVIDPMPEPVEGQRIAPLPLPGGARARAWRGAMSVRADGTVPLLGTRGGVSDVCVADLREHSLTEAWERLLLARAQGCASIPAWAVEF